MDIAQAVRSGEVAATEVTASILSRINQINPRINALANVNVNTAQEQATRADALHDRDANLEALRGVPITIKINIDVAGQPTTDGVVAFKDQIAETDSPLVANLRQAGAVIVGRSNTPCFSLQWFTENELHGATLNPFDASRTPGGSSGGAAAAVATGMGPIAHGNDYGGSVRYPAWACGVVGLRTSVGRVPAYRGTAPNRVISNQLMSTQGVLTRNIADARLALLAMEPGSPLDPNWRAAPQTHNKQAPCKVALFKQHPAYNADASVVAALKSAANWLEDAGYIVEVAEPPHFEEAAMLWRRLVFEDLRRGIAPLIRSVGSTSVRNVLDFYYGDMKEWGRDEYLDGLARRLVIARAWSQFFAVYPILLMPVSWEKPFNVGEDQKSQDRLEEMLRAQSPLLSTALLGLPGLSVPTGLTDGMPTGVQLVSAPFQEDLLLDAGAQIESASKFSALTSLLQREIVKG